MSYSCKNLVVGCGNILFKDDGFGPRVIEALNKYFADKEMPEDTKFVDGGVGAPQYIFSLPDPSWEKVIVIDALEFNGEPGELRIYSPNNMVINEYGGAHAVPLDQSLLTLTRMGVEVVIVGCKLKEVTEPDVVIGLSEEVEAAIPKAVDMVLEQLDYKK